MTAQDRANIFTDDDEDLIIAVPFLVLTIYIFWNNRMHRYEPYYQREPDYQPIFQMILYICLFVVNLLFSVIFVIGVHRDKLQEYYKMLVMFCAFSILEVFVTGGVLGWTVYREVTKYQNMHYEPFNYWKKQPAQMSMMIVPLVFNIIMPIYLMVVIRSELYKILQGPKKQTRDRRGCE